MTKRKVLFVNDEMVVGGVSRVLNNLLSEIDSEKYEIDLLVLHKHGEMLKDVPSYVNVIEGSKFFEVCDITIRETFNEDILLFIKKIIFFIYLKTGFITKKIIKERKKMNLKQYDVEIAFKEGFCSIFTAAGNSAKKINWIHADYKIKNYAENYMSTVTRELKKFDHHIAVSKTAASSFAEVFNLKNVDVIHNVIKVDQILEKSKEIVDCRDETITFISIGRLHPQKAYDRLIRVCGDLIKKGYNFKIYIIGDGEQKGQLETLIKSLELENVVLLLGSKQNPFPYLKQADCFVLSSIYEGLPTVVYESLILGVPVLATRVAGVDEQITDKTGMIVENKETALYKGMEQILLDSSLINNWKHELSFYKYDNDEIIGNIYKLID